MPEQLTIQSPAPRPSALAAMASRFNVEPTKLLDTLKNTAFKGATDSQMMALCIVANEMGLNPFLKEVYAFPTKGGGIEPVVGVDGWIKRVNEHPAYDGMEEEFTEAADGKPHSCTVTIHRKDRKLPTRHRELYSECVRSTDPWRNQPHRMLGHRAFIQCARKAFGFSGMDADEADRMHERQVNGRVVESARPALFGQRAEQLPPPASTPEDLGEASAVGVAGAVSAGTPALPNAHTEDVAVGVSAASESSRPATKRAATKPKPDGGTLTLDNGQPPENTAWQRLASRLASEGIAQEPFEKWLASQSFPRLAMLSQSECGEIESLWSEMKEACK